MESLHEGYAAFYSAELAKKVKRGIMENALKCKWNGGGWPVGYFIDNERHLQIDPLTAPFILETFKRYAAGDTILKLGSASQIPYYECDMADTGYHCAPPA